MTNNNPTYAPIDLCACFDYMPYPPEESAEECRIYWHNQNPFRGAIQRRIGNTWFTIEIECAGSEKLAEKVERLMFSDKNL